MLRGNGRSVVLWLILIGTILVPVTIAATSPLLQWREPVYIAAGLAGVLGLVMLLFQPLLIGGHLPGIEGARRARVHALTGSLLVLLVVLHVVGLYLTSPPDVLDALLFRSPTLFSLWGVVAMWAIFLAALLALLRKRIALSPLVWRAVHTGLAIVIVTGTTVHALLIEGTMGMVSKGVLCLCVMAATARVIVNRRVFNHVLRRWQD